MDPHSKILVVDDVSVFRELEARFLAASGQVMTASNGRDALELVRQELPEVVVADFALPDIDGDALCKEVKSDPDLAGVSVILVTRGLDAESRARAIRAGADDVVTKPIERMALIEAVSRFLRVPVARALPRVALATPVTITSGGGRRYAGRSRTLSRGGIFVETDFEAPPGTEVGVAFRLPDTCYDVASTARVVWRKSDAHSAETLSMGMGLQFLRMDGPTARRIEEYVSERVPTRAESS